VIYIGTFSKAIAPAIRMSYLVLPRPLLKRYQEKSGFLNSTVSKVDQLILKKFIEEGHFERHLNKTRALYKSRHDTLLSCLKSRLCRTGGDMRQGIRPGNACKNEGPLFRISGEHAGVHLLLHVLNGMTEEELIGRAYTEDIKQSEARRYVRECLLVNPYITKVEDIEVEFDRGTLCISARLETVYGEETIYV